jgi:hypothetical protein
MEAASEHCKPVVICVWNVRYFLYNAGFSPNHYYPWGGCLLNPFCMASSQQSQMYGAMELFCGRSIAMVCRWVDVWCKRILVDFNALHTWCTLPSSCTFCLWRFLRTLKVIKDNFLCSSCGCMSSNRRLPVFQRNLLPPDRLCGLVVRVLGYRSRGPSSIPGTTRFSEK